MLFSFDDFIFDCAGRELRCGQEAIKVEPQVFDLLEYLIRNRDRVVSKDDLFAAVWKGRIVSDATLASRISAARTALKDNGEEQRLIRTVLRKGVRFVGTVRERDQSGGLADSADAYPVLPKKPSIAVLAFDNMSGDSEQDYFSDGISEDITTRLSKVRGLFVIARHSAFAYKGKTTVLRAIGRELGVRYLMEGSVRKSGDRLRITAQLIDSFSDHHIWADSYDRELTDVFAVQDDVAVRIVEALTEKLVLHDENLRVGGTANFNAYDSFLCGREHVFRYSKQSNVQARRMFEQALRLDPNYAGAHALLGYTFVVEYINNWSSDGDKLLQCALSAGQQAAEIDNRDVSAHWLLGIIHNWMRDHDSAIAEAEEAVNIDPNFANGYASLAQACCYAGFPEKAIDSVQTAMRLDPYYPDIYLHFLGHAQFLQGNYEDAVTTLKRRVLRNPGTDATRVLLAASYGQLSRADEARSEWLALQQAKPGYSIERRRHVLPYRNPADFERIIDGLNRAEIITK